MSKLGSKEADKYGYNNMKGNSIKNVGVPVNPTDAMTFAMPSFTTTERDAIDASNGMVIYNETDNKFQGYENGAWANII